MPRNAMVLPSKRSSHPRPRVFQPKHRGTTHHHQQHHHHRSAKSDTQPPSNAQADSPYTPPQKTKEKTFTCGFYPVQTASELIKMLEAINTNMEYEAAKIRGNCEEYIRRVGEKAVSMDRIHLDSSLEFQKQLHFVIATILESMEYTHEAYNDALDRFSSRTLPGSGKNGVLTSDEISQIDQRVNMLMDLRYQVTGSSMPIALTEGNGTRVAFDEAVRLQTVFTVAMFRNPDDYARLVAYTVADEAISKCGILRRAGLSASPDLLLAADEEAYANGKVIFDALEATVTDQLELHGIDEVEASIAWSVYDDNSEFIDAAASAYGALFAEDQNQ
ncbi:hypothetical protein Poli38472_004675 [Pythium oligandrum]|uniref:Uncharacterized protein n=1 Tax=Pythium oligandrum TaxID=41045 RepID=A0A8K1CAX2_PYTOL|nr:hypothetical protein Poli38472_004675 [Pythium oligandrum]|eukprot:TMW59606.1 hypothetical protein Poli38472_004675 [Pythium oligandrum]